MRIQRGVRESRPPPPGKSQVIWVYLDTSTPWKKLDPLLPPVIKLLFKPMFDKAYQAAYFDQAYQAAYFDQAYQAAYFDQAYQAAYLG